MAQPTPSSSDALTFVVDICGALKKIKRTGWVMRQIPFPESDSDHMHRCAMLALMAGTQTADPRDDYSTPEMARFHPERIDGTKLLRMAVTHDVCEALAGDLTPFCKGIDSKYEKEKAAMLEIQKTIGDPLGKELYDLWQEYEEQKTTEALLCKDIDKFEMVVQAYEYENEHLREKPADVDPLADLMDGEALPSVVDQPLRRFYKTTRSCLRSPLFRRLDGELRNKREGMLKDRGGWGVTDEEKSHY